MQKPEFVSSCKPNNVTVPAPVKVQVPFIITLLTSDKEESQPKAHRFTPAFRVGFSVYVPGFIKMVSPEEAAVRAEAIVV